jgi:N6-L-threonylcarbamoyladenine synthase
VVRSDGLVVSDVVASQIALHAPYGGVVPELAARAHMENIVPVVERALEKVPGGLAGIDGIAVTNGPGLVGALLVGVQVGKSLALAQSLPLVGVNHLIGHLLAVYLRRDEAADPAGPAFPFIALLVSGGHTALYEVRSAFDIEQLGQTRDDAAGEAFDKVAKLLGLGYPGLKTAVAQRVAALEKPIADATTQDVCASFQKNAVSVLVQKSLQACAERNVPRLVITGGVAANRGLRQLAQEAATAAGVSLHVPPFASCTDNAAMIAYAGAQRLQRGENDGSGLAVFSRSPILGAVPGSPATRRYKSSRLPRTTA